MPRRELLTPAERETLLVIPVGETERIRHYTPSRADLGFVRQHRWDHNRLGIAIQLCYLRYPGRVLARGETPPPALLGMIATQVNRGVAEYWPIDTASVWKCLIPTAIRFRDQLTIVGFRSPLIPGRF